MVFYFPRFDSEIFDSRFMPKDHSELVKELKEKNPVEFEVYNLCVQITFGRGDHDLNSRFLASIEKLQNKVGGKLWFGLEFWQIGDQFIDFIF